MNQDELENVPDYEQLFREEVRGSSPPPTYDKNTLYLVMMFLSDQTHQLCFFLKDRKYRPMIV